MIDTNKHKHHFTEPNSRSVINQEIASNLSEQSNFFSGPLLLPKAVASILCVTVQTLSSWRCKGKYNLSYVKIGSKVLYRQSDVQAFIESRMERK